MSEPSERELRIDPKDLVWKVCRGSGPGGQKRNMTESAVQLTHTPTGLAVRIESERSQTSNKATALAILRARLQQQIDEEEDRKRANDRKSKLGSGMRGDKIRTIRVQDGIVSDHRTGKRISLRSFLHGDLTGLRTE